MESRKGTAAQSGMFRQLTGGLESVITAIVEAMPSNVHLHTGTLVSDIRYVEGMYAIDVANQYNNSCGCQSMADHVIISTPPATYTQWFKDDQGFDFLRSMEHLAVPLLLCLLIKAPLMVISRDRVCSLLETQIRLLQHVLFLIKNGLKQRQMIRWYCASLSVSLAMM